VNAPVKIWSTPVLERDFEAEIYIVRPCPFYSGLNPWCQCATCRPVTDMANAWNRYHEAMEPEGKRMSDEDPGMREWGIAQIRVGD
jgi:hypothetical protein